MKKHALGATSIRVFDTALKLGATRIEIGREIHWLRADALLDDSPLSTDALTELVDDLQALGARADGPTELSVHGPLGPVRFTVELTRHGVSIRLALTEDEAAGEVAFSELMQKLIALRGNRVECTSTEARFLQGLSELETLPLVAGAFELLYAHGRKLAGSQAETGTGEFVLFCEGGARVAMRVLLIDEHAVWFTFR